MAPSPLIFKEAIMDYEVMKGSLASNLITMFSVIILYILREKCKHSKCTSHTLCCNLEINDESSTKEIEESLHQV